MVVPHLHLLADKHAEPDAEAITHEHVQDKRVPPALLEVGQQVGERHLGRDRGHTGHGHSWNKSFHLDSHMFTAIESKYDFF